MRLIDAVQVCALCKQAKCDYIRCNESGNCVIADAPTIDAVEVVRCKDCEEYIPWLDGKICGLIGSYFGNTKPNDFCSRGRRKKAGE